MDGSSIEDQDMPSRTIGPLEVSLVGLGCNNFGRRIDADGARDVTLAALDAGITLFDTADTYGEGRSEEMLGAALAGRRDQAVIATKFGMKLDEQRRGAHPDYVMSACEDSLRRLGVDHIDLYQLHRPDPEVPIVETLGALGELIEAGKVRAIGHSNFDPDQMGEAEVASGSPGAGRFVCAQDEWNLLDRELEDGKLAAIERHGLVVLPYYPLASGLLTGKYRAGEDPDPSWRIANHPAERREAQLADARLATVDRLRGFAEARGRSLLELAFSWLASQPVVASVIAGASSVEQVSANAAAATWELTEEELAEVDRLTGRAG
jgi:aryl-alcohol dehydrogenase-like predicted oxidoreductase